MFVFFFVLSLIRVKLTCGMTLMKERKQLKKVLCTDKRASCSGSENNKLHNHRRDQTSVVSARCPLVIVCLLSITRYNFMILSAGNLPVILSNVKYHFRSVSKSNKLISNVIKCLHFYPAIYWIYFFMFE